MPRSRRPSGRIVAAPLAGRVAALGGCRLVEADTEISGTDRVRYDPVLDGAVTDSTVPAPAARQMGLLENAAWAIAVSASATAVVAAAHGFAKAAHPHL